MLGQTFVGSGNDDVLDTFYSSIGRLVETEMHFVHYSLGTNGTGWH